MLGLALLWDSGIPIKWEVAGFLWLAGAAFALFQAGIRRWLGLPGMALLGPLYLMAPAVAAVPPELLNPIYRAALWSWTPFRFTTEGLRSLLYLGPGRAGRANRRVGLRRPGSGWLVLDDHFEARSALGPSCLVNIARVHIAD